ncbi:MAG: 16S rRNA (cytosine(1402)-N(4))-methyltransferase RsmH [Propionibacteriaceae bacterium]|nr:16S rRNA (cytosine(1402)-N(4))-methyltransferase RsmH [Propionibacteriaceae bacterium]
MNDKPVELIHQPVMLERVRELLGPALSRPQATYLDCTLGLGGHAAALLEDHPGLRVIGIDRDRAALELAAARLGTGEFRNTTYDHLDEVLESAGITHVDGILMDLGLSSLQIDDPGRGFSYLADGPLDMRMSRDEPLTAADLLGEVSAPTLAKMLRSLGGEVNAARIAQAIKAAGPVATTGELVSVIDGAVPPHLRGNGHGAKRTFQALRIQLNRELLLLEQALPKALSALVPGGRLVVLAFHSGEDRLVKAAFAKAASDRAPAGLPQVPPELEATHELLTRGAEKAGAKEIKANPRAASVRLRAIQRRAVGKVA